MMDDWLKRDRFVFIGWSGLILFPCAYLCLGGWFTGTTFMSSWFTHGLSSSYIEGCNFLTATVSTPANCMDHSSLFLWGREAHGSLPIWALPSSAWTLAIIAFGAGASSHLAHWPLSRNMTGHSIHSICWVLTQLSAFAIVSQLERPSCRSLASNCVLSRPKASCLCCSRGLSIGVVHFECTCLSITSGLVCPELFRWCLRSSQRHSASPRIERLASSIFLVAALECPEHLQFEGHCWHKLSRTFFGAF